MNPETAFPIAAPKPKKIKREDAYRHETWKQGNTASGENCFSFAKIS